MDFNNVPPQPQPPPAANAGEQAPQAAQPQAAAAVLTEVQLTGLVTMQERIMKSLNHQAFPAWNKEGNVNNEQFLRRLKGAISTASVTTERYCQFENAEMFATFNEYLGKFADVSTAEGVAADF